MADYEEISPSKPAINWPTNLRDVIPHDKVQNQIPAFEYKSLIDELIVSDNSITIWNILGAVIKQPLGTLQTIYFLIQLITRGAGMFKSIFLNWRTSLGGFLIALANFAYHWITTGNPLDVWTLVLSFGIMFVGAFLPDYPFIEKLLKQLLEDYEKKKLTEKK